jgi:hypothetical protein
MDAVASAVTAAYGSVLLATSPGILLAATLALLFFGNRPEIPALAFWGRYAATVGVAGTIGVIFLRRLALGLPPLSAMGWLFLGSQLPLAVVALVSAAVNGTGTRDLVLSALIYLRYPLFGAALVSAGRPAGFFRAATWAFVGLSLLQVPVAAAQFAGGASGDALNGTLGANGMLIAATLVAQVILLANWLTIGRHHGLHALAIVALFVPGVLADIQVSAIFLPLTAAYMIARLTGWRRVFLVALAFLLTAAVGIALLVALQRMSPTLAEYSPDVAHYRDTLTLDDPEFTSESSLGRLTVLAAGVGLLAEDSVQLAIGYGPEAAQGGLATSVDLEDPVGGAACQALLARGFRCREPQIFRFVMEFGLLGAAAAYAGFALLWAVVARTAKGRAAEARLLARSFDGVAFLVIVLAPWYIGAWRMDAFSLPLWLLASAACVARRPAAAGGGQ